MEKGILLQKIFDKTCGQCHICHKKLSYSNYGKHDMKGAWHIEHSIPKARGGTDHLNNLLPACIPCNLEKGIRHTRTVRSWKGNTRAPLSKKQKDKIKNENAIAGALIGGTIGLIGGPIGVAIGAGLGSYLGKQKL